MSVFGVPIRKLSIPLWLDFGAVCDYSIAALATAFAISPVRAQTANSELVRLWGDANDRCRDNPKTGATCAEREHFAKRLDDLGFCYGHQGDSSSDMYWHHCDARLLRRAYARVANRAACVVNESTPTPLNYRTAPYGLILGTIENGWRVLIIDRSLDAHGKPWIYIAGAEDEKPIGWVFKQYVDCF